MNNTINLPKLNGKTTRAKPLIFPKSDFFPLPTFHLKPILAALTAHMTPFQKRGTIPFPTAKYIRGVGIILIVNNLPPQFGLRVIISLYPGSQQTRANIP
jgi:hypothetical protein